MKRNYAYKIRLYPNKEQAILIDKTIGCCRLMYNLMLSERKDVYKKLKDDRDTLYHYKYKTPKQIKDENLFMYKVDSQSFNWVKVNLKNAYDNFFKSVFGSRKGGKLGFPQFKKKKNGGSYTTSFINNNIRFDYENFKIKLPSLKWVKFKDNRISKDQIKQATISKTPSGKYYCSILFEREIEEVQKIELNENSKVIGLDMSLSNFFVDSNGNSPLFSKRYRKSEKKLKRLNHIISRKEKSNRRKKLRKSINRINEKIKNQRTDFCHKLSTQLVKDNDVIVVESLNLKAMSQCLKLGKSVMDLGYSQFINQLQYKCEWYGKYLVQADKWFASSKICHNCGYKYQDLTLMDRKWVCPNCDTEINRDENAAINLKQLGMSYVHKCTQSQSVATTMKCVDCENH